MSDEARVLHEWSIEHCNYRFLSDGTLLRQAIFGDEPDDIGEWDSQEEVWPFREVGPELARLVSSHRWIPVSERLPEEDVDVLVYIPGADKVMALSYFPNPDSWTDCRSLYFDIDGSMWQPFPPLPEPPKESR